MLRVVELNSLVYNKIRFLVLILGGGYVFTLIYALFS